ncbi:MAG: hypothetical protein NTY06_01300 [Candidatus Gottesmanbacteria bacterium]|nr:hypothetical protein [Candidatus Gottesmanbacteria bacterium]
MQLSTTEAIQQIQEIYHQQYAPDSFFDALDQLLICETLAKSSPVLPIHNQDGEENEATNNTSVSGSVNDSCKPKINAALFENKQSVIAQLKICTYRTSPIEIAELLRILFVEYPSHSGHWLYIAQHWSPRRINGVINRLVGFQRSGSKTIVNPPAYFTFLIKKRARRKGQ